MKYPKKQTRYFIYIYNFFFSTKCGANFVILYCPNFDEIIIIEHSSVCEVGGVAPSL